MTLDSQKQKPRLLKGWCFIPSCSVALEDNSESITWLSTPLACWSSLSCMFSWIRINLEGAIRIPNDSGPCLSWFLLLLCLGKVGLLYSSWFQEHSTIWREPRWQQLERAGNMQEWKGKARGNSAKLILHLYSWGSQLREWCRTYL